MSDARLSRSKDNRRGRRLLATGSWEEDTQGCCGEDVGEWIESEDGPKGIRITTEPTLPQASASLTGKPSHGKPEREKGAQATYRPGLTSNVTVPSVPTPAPGTHSEVTACHSVMC